MGRNLFETLIGADGLIKPGGEIKITQSSVNIEGLIGKFIYGGGGGMPSPPFAMSPGGR